MSDFRLPKYNSLAGVVNSTLLVVFVPLLSEVKQRDAFMNRDCPAYTEKFRGCPKAKEVRCKLKQAVDVLSF